MVFAPSSSILVYSLLPEEVALSIIQQIIGTDAAAGGPLLWPISNKYYSSRVKFLPYYSLDEAASQASGYPAVLVLTGKDTTFDAKCLARLASDDIDVALVYCADATSPDEEERLAGECLDHGFEFVSNATSSQSEDGAQGTARLREALQTHVWTNEDEPAGLSPSLQSTLPVSSAPLLSDTIPSEFEDDFAPFVSADAATEDDLDSFEALAGMMGQLKGLREHAQGLDHDERLAFAERIATDFAGKMH